MACIEVHTHDHFRYINVSDLIDINVSDWSDGRRLGMIISSRICLGFRVLGVIFWDGGCGCGCGCGWGRRSMSMRDLLG